MVEYKVMTLICIFSQETYTEPVKMTKVGRKVKIPEKLRYNTSRPLTQESFVVTDEFVKIPDVLQTSVDT